jgi:hypothetical protein
MKTFEMPNIEVITFTAESIMDVSTPPVGEDMTPWG